MEQASALIAALSKAVDTRVFALLLARLLPIVALTPLFGGRQTPRRFRFAVAAFLAAALYPGVASAWDLSALEFGMLGAVAREALLGLMVALVVSAVFELFAAIGGLLDLARGSNLANVLDPLTQEQSSILGPFLRLLLLVSLTATGLNRVFLRALFDGLVALPPSAPLGWRGDGLQLLATCETLFVTAVKLALPGLAALLVLDVALGLVNRAASQVQVFFLGMTIKGVVGLAVLLLVLAVTLHTWLQTAAVPLVAWTGGR